MDTSWPALVARITEQAAALLALITNLQPVEPTNDVQRYAEAAEAVLGNLAAVLTALVLLVGVIAVGTSLLNELSGGWLLPFIHDLPGNIKILFILLGILGLLAATRVLVAVAMFVRMYRLPALLSLAATSVVALRVLGGVLMGEPVTPRVLLNLGRVLVGMEPLPE